jgi:hypothetical protein
MLRSCPTSKVLQSLKITLCPDSQPSAVDAARIAREFGLQDDWHKGTANLDADGLRRDSLLHEYAAHSAFPIDSCVTGAGEQPLSVEQWGQGFGNTQCAQLIAIFLYQAFVDMRPPVRTGQTRTDHEWDNIRCGLPKRGECAPSAVVGAT